MNREFVKHLALMQLAPALTQYGLVWLGILLIQPDTTTSPFWGAVALTIIVSLELWPQPGGSWRPLAASWLGMAAATAAAAVQAGLPPGRAVLMAVGNGAAAFIVAALWLRWRSTDDLAPANRVDVLKMVALSWLCGGLVVALGGTWPIQSWSSAVIWVFYIATNLTVGLPGSLIIFHSRRRSSLTPVKTRWLILLAVPALACLALPIVAPDYPLQWVVLAPFLWVGLAATPKWVAALGSVTAGAVVVAAGTAYRNHVDSGLPTDVWFEMLNGFGVILSLIMVYGREETAEVHRAVGDLHIRQVSRNRVLSQVFAHMGDGVLLLDASGQVQFSNQSAQRLFGVALPDKASVPAWRRAFTFCDAATGRAVSDRELHEFLHPEGGTAQLQVHSDSAGGTSRVLTMVNHVAAIDGGTHRVILVRDTTTQTEQQHQLQAFAGAVARQLKHPLWDATDAISEADSAIARAQPGRAQAHLGQAQVATSRMRNLIDDYLDSTVAREGAVNPEVLDLHDLVDEVVSRSEALAQAAVIVRSTHKVTSDPALTRHLMRRVLEYVASASPREPTVSLQTRAYRTSGWVEVALEVPSARGELSGLAYQNPLQGSPYGGGVSETPSQHQATGTSTLAVCEAIVQRHGGRLETGTGADGGVRVSFTLPDA